MKVSTLVWEAPSRLRVMDGLLLPVRQVRPACRELMVSRLAKVLSKRLHKYPHLLERHHRFEPRIVGVLE